MKMNILPAITLLIIAAGCRTEEKTAMNSDSTHTELHRPQFHFTPAAHWMNDPNGMVYLNGTYHLFFQYYPDSTVWGPMHWGHATSTDLVNWQHQPIALYPDSLGYIFSGSCVVDSNNTSGFGKDGKVPMVAIFTHHNMAGEKAGTNNFQNESIAYSLDEAKTWTKYSGNPVLKNPGIKDFRDPKVMWFAAGKKWIMTLATKDRVTFYSSPNLKEWTKATEFGAAIGAHGGVWECPDLFSLNYEGKTIWVLTVSINPGGPNGGSATQYFTGNFDGKTFTPFQTDTRWIDYGTDDYAGVTWSNTGGRKIFLGWMSNWQYATKVPTQSWRSAMTLPRELSLQLIAGKYYLNSYPVKEISSLNDNTKELKNIAVNGSYNVSDEIKTTDSLLRLDMTATNKNFEIILSNKVNEQVGIGYDKANNRYYIDRTNAGKKDFDTGFAKRHFAPRISTDSTVSITLIVDVASAELFADGGLTAMTDIYFPNQAFTKITVKSNDGVVLKTLAITGLKPALGKN